MNNRPPASAGDINGPLTDEAEHSQDVINEETNEAGARL